MMDEKSLDDLFNGDIGSFDFESFLNEWNQYGDWPFGSSTFPSQETLQERGRGQALPDHHEVQEEGSRAFENPYHNEVHEQERRPKSSSYPAAMLLAANRPTEYPRYNHEMLSSEHDGTAETPCLQGSGVLEDPGLLQTISPAEMGKGSEGDPVLANREQIPFRLSENPQNPGNDLGNGRQAGLEQYNSKGIGCCSIWFLPAIPSSLL